jgi:hypothetical protein
MAAKSMLSLVQASCAELLECAPGQGVVAHSTVATPAATVRLEMPVETALSNAAGLPSSIEMVAAVVNEAAV